MLNGAPPIVVLIPERETFSRTPGRGLKDLRNRQLMGLFVSRDKYD
jgi:hypothetical protein